MIQLLPFLLLDVEVASLASCGQQPQLPTPCWALSFSEGIQASMQQEPFFRQRLCLFELAWFPTSEYLAQVSKTRLVSEVRVLQQYFSLLRLQQLLLFLCFHLDFILDLKLPHLAPLEASSILKRSSSHSALHHAMLPHLLAGLEEGFRGRSYPFGSSLRDSCRNRPVILACRRVSHRLCSCDSSLTPLLHRNLNFQLAIRSSA